jgi:hypothetical protein
VKEASSLREAVGPWELAYDVVRALLVFVIYGAAIPRRPGTTVLPIVVALITSGLLALIKRWSS